MSLPPSVRFEEGSMAIEELVAIARAEARPVLSEDPAFRARIARGADFLDHLLREDGVIYGDDRLRRLVHCARSCRRQSGACSTCWAGTRRQWRKTVASTCNCC